MTTLDVSCFEALAAFDEDHKPEVLAEMVRLFADDANAWLVEADRAVVGGDLVVLRRVGHSLKSACATIGAGHMRTLATQLEDAAVAARAADAAVIVRALAGECAVVLDCLRPYVL